MIQQQELYAPPPAKFRSEWEYETPRAHVAPAVAPVALRAPSAPSVPPVRSAARSSRALRAPRAPHSGSSRESGTERSTEPQRAAHRQSSASPQRHAGTAAARVEARGPAPFISASLDPIRTSGRAAVESAACPHPITLRSEHVDTTSGEVIGRGPDTLLPCDTWSCIVCGHDKRRRLVAHYAQKFSSSSAIHLCTFTLDPSTNVQAHESRKYIVYLWKLWRKQANRLARKCNNGANIEYVATVEFQKRTGLAHLHVIADLPGIEPDAAAALWTGLGGGIVADVQPVARAKFFGAGEDGPRGSVQRAVGYVLKYALKDATENAVKGRRYVLASQGTGYYAKEPRAARRAYVEAQTGQPMREPSPWRAGPAPGLAVCLVPAIASGRRDCPDTVTPEDRRRFAELRATPARTSYRYLDKRSKLWWSISQDGPVRTRERIEPPERWSLSQPPPWAARRP